MPPTEKRPDMGSTKPKFHRYPFWSPRFWHGMRLGDWLALLGRNGFRIHPARMPMAGIISGFAVGNSMMNLLQGAVYGRRVRDAVVPPPVFIIGHWRSGTTYLHELMSLDTRFCSPTTYQCFAANHFLLTGSWLPQLTWFFMPKKRPTDDVEMGWNQPQEDEFALVNMGIPSPYLRMAFPNHPPVYLEYLDLEGLSAEELQAWKAGLFEFVRRMTVQNDRRLVLKSPTHTGRVKVLAEMFPGARFIHVVRDPRKLVPSTLRLWQSLDEPQGLQLARHEGLEEYAFACYERMYAGFRRGREAVSPDHICDVKFEQLVADPVGQLEAVYEKLGLGDFQSVRPELERYADKKKDYKINEHQLPAELEEKIKTRWHDYDDAYGYGL